MSEHGPMFRFVSFRYYGEEALWNATGKIPIVFLSPRHKEKKGKKRRNERKKRKRGGAALCLYPDFPRLGRQAVGMG